MYRLIHGTDFSFLTVVILSSGLTHNSYNKNVNHIHGVFVSSRVTFIRKSSFYVKNTRVLPSGTGRSAVPNISAESEWTPWSSTSLTGLLGASCSNECRMADTWTLPRRALRPATTSPPDTSNRHIRPANTSILRALIYG